MAIFSVLTTLFSFLATFPTEVGGPMLFQLHRGEVEKAFNQYLTFAHEHQEHDFSLLQQAGIRLLEQGIETDDPEIQLMCMFGAGVAMSSELMPILEKGVKSKDMKTQMIALSYLGRLQDDQADLILLDALSSPFLLTRLETLLHLAKKNHPAVIGHLRSLMVKVPEPIRAVFGQIAIHLEDSEGTFYLRQLLTDSDINVRVETILTVAQAKRDDFLPVIRRLASEGHHAQQEACAIALGDLKDHRSLNRLEELSKSNRETLRLSAAIALFELGERGALKIIEDEAKQGSLFAISALGKLKEGKEILHQLLKHEERDVRLNATLSLLLMRDPEALLTLDEVLIRDGRDLGFMRTSSAGGGLHAWKTIPSASHQKKGYIGLVQQTAKLREKILTQCIDFEEKDFLQVARLILDKKQNALIPLLMELLINRKSDAVLQLLKEGRQKAGAPFIRNYCTLALYRLKEEGPYEEELIAWVKKASKEDLIRFKETDESAPSLTEKPLLTPEETSRLLIETFEVLASAQNQAGIEALIHTIAYGNPKNRYALAGLLIRTTE